MRKVALGVVVEVVAGDEVLGAYACCKVAGEADRVSGLM